MELQKRIIACRNNPYELNNFITEYKPFITKSVQEHVGRFVEYGRDDELSVGLMAFEEAIRSYDMDKGSFLTFAKNVIKRRLIDEYRKEKKHNNTIPLSSFYDENEDKQIDITEKQAIIASKELDESSVRKLEILDIQKELSEYEISFFDLPNISPKHAETKIIYKEMINAVINSSDLLNTLKSKKYLPIAQIEKITGIHRKKIERARKYIIAVSIILTGDYKYIQNFINWR